MSNYETVDTQIGQITESEERFFGAVASDYGIDTIEDIKIIDDVRPRLFQPSETIAGERREVVRRFVRAWEAGREDRRSMTLWVERELQTRADSFVEMPVVRSVIGSYAPLSRDGVGRQHPHRLLGNKRKRKRSR